MRIVVLGLALALAGPAALAAEPAAGPRYAFVPVSGGALRLDTVSGEMARCAIVAGGGAECVAVTWAAPPAAPDHSALEARVADLEARIAEFEAARTEAIPDDVALEPVMALSDHVMRRFFALVRDFKQGPAGEAL